MGREVLAPMPGKIHEIMVDIGDRVEADEEIIVIEAMKMENSVYTPVDGRVAEIRVEEDEKVEVDQVLVILD
ncbi:MAG: acetyl-CoA carboxylase biotin carboxyl carrier protein subunit [Syntrophales bacterium]|jgi:biotin carboxyl carrier protein|nr:acetyl-CoA carboxylase biotin carboxyl carrier protein subunit [Syntrophales bacterium]MDY0043923.1 acetyl-CoA carboxylase biotin carboxyl carrier protein subunit [Syntrophales bacterium]